MRMFSGPVPGMSSTSRLGLSLSVGESHSSCVPAVILQLAKWQAHWLLVQELRADGLPAFGWSRWRSMSPAGDQYISTHRPPYGLAWTSVVQLPSLPIGSRTVSCIT